jgi:ribosomal protein S15P/S13E
MIDFISLFYPVREIQCAIILPSPLLNEQANGHKKYKHHRKGLSALELRLRRMTKFLRKMRMDTKVSRNYGSAEAAHG